MPPVQMTRAEYEAKYGKAPVVASSVPVKMTRAEYEAKYGTPEKTTLNPYTNVPVLGQLSNFGIGAGSAIGRTVAGIPEGVSRLLGGASKIVGMKGLGESFTRNADTMKKTSDAILAKPFEKSLDTFSGQAGSMTGYVAPFFLSGGISSPGTPILARLATGLKGAGIDTLTGLAQTGGDIKAGGATGLTSLVANTIVPGSGGFISRTAKGTIPGYVGDVSQGLAGQRGEDRTGSSAFIPGLGTASAGLLAGISTKLSPEYKAYRNNEIIKNRADEILKIENNYVKTRKNLDFSKDKNFASRTRIASTDVLANSVDEGGLIRTKGKGGAIDQYKAMTLDGMEGVVRKDLVNEGATVSPDIVKAYLVDNLMKSGLEGKALKNALSGVDDEVAGLMLRANPEGEIPLAIIHDAKISTTNGINYATEPHVKTGAKSVASAYKTLIEKNSKRPIEAVNKELQKYLQDIALLESLDGRKVAGGKLGKYFAQISGNIIGGAAGAVGGPVGSSIGAILGGEVGGKIKGNILSKTLGGVTGNTVPKNKVLEDALQRSKATPYSNNLGNRNTQYNPIKTSATNVIPQSIPTKPIASNTQGKAKLGTVLGAGIGSQLGWEKNKDGKWYYNPAKGAIGALGGGALGAVAPKGAEMYKNTPNKQGGFAAIPGGKESLGDAKYRRLNEEVWKERGMETLPNGMLRKIGEKVDDLTIEARKYKTAEEFVNAQKVPIYHGTDKIFNEFDIKKSADGTIWFTDNKAKIEGGEVSASGKGQIMERFINENDLKLGGWNETDKYSVDELIQQGYDGLKLPGEGETTYQIFNPEKLKTKSQLTDIWKKANKKAVELPKATSLEQEAKKYKSAEEFVNTSTELTYKNLQENPYSIKAYGKDFNEPVEYHRAGTIKKNGDIWLTDNPAGASQYSSAGGGTKTGSYVVQSKNPLIIDTAGGKYANGNIDINKILTKEEVAQGYTNNPTTKQKFIDYAKKNGYDAVQFADSFPDGEGGMRSLVVWNKDQIKTKSQLTDIWKQANPEASFSPEVKRIMNMRR